MKKIFKKITPNKEKLQNSKFLRPIAPFLTKPQIWHINRRTITSGIAIGFFFGSLPIVGQMFLAAVVAIFLRANMPIAITATLISNPFTMPFFFTANYHFGAWLLNKDALHLKEIDWSLESLLNLGGNILVPLYFGSLVMGIGLALFAFAAIRIWWRVYIVFSHRKRKKRILR